MGLRRIESPLAPMMLAAGITLIGLARFLSHAGEHKGAGHWRE